MLKGAAEIIESWFAGIANVLHGKKGYGNSGSASHLESGQGGRVFHGKVEERGGIHGVGTGSSRK